MQARDVIAKYETRRRASGRVDLGAAELDRESDGVPARR